MAASAFRLTLLAAMILAACGAASPAGQQSVATAATAPAPPGDSFHGKITAATGRQAGEHGDVVVVLSHPPRAGNASTTLTLAIRTTRCGVQHDCLHLKGQLSGRMTLQHSLPDVGHKFQISARGRVTPLGQVKVSGTATGTGFIHSGHTALDLTLRSARATVTLEGQSGVVPGRTDP